VIDRSTLPRHPDQALIARTLALLGDIDLPPGADGPGDHAGLTSLLDRIDALATPDPAPIRTIHHLSCTGGTLITKCLAAMPNVLVLNEVDPLSPLPPFESPDPLFTPTDVAALVRQGDPRVKNELLEQLFLAGMAILREEQTRIGRAVILRDHSHSHFLTGPDLPDRASLYQIVSARFPIRSIVTVRDPIDTFLSMCERGWHKHFAPSTYDEYCRRYLAFLDCYSGLPTVAYETFVSDPSQTMKTVCGWLELDYSEHFEKLFSVFRFSGDCGRAGSDIRPRPQRNRPDALLQEAAASPHHQQLMTILAKRTDFS
jgi:hypothetical protein